MTTFPRISKDVDLAGLYAQHMQHHGCGKGLFMPVAAADLSPPCCGFFDRNGDWNLISNLEHNVQGSELQENGFVGLREQLRDVTSIDIKWQPKTSTGVRESTVDTSAGTRSAVLLRWFLSLADGRCSTNVAGGADAHIKYNSQNRFGAVLMTTKPVVLKAFHQERMFMHWLEDNKHKLHNEYGSQVRKYGLWIITKTYSTHGASINAWYDDNKDVMISINAKANMLGEIKSDLEQSDKVMDKDWCHYSGNGPYTGSVDDERLVVFADGIEMKPSYWWLRHLEYALPGSTKSKSPNPAIDRIKLEELQSTPAKSTFHTQNPESLSHPEQRQIRPRQFSDNRTNTFVDEKEYSITFTPNTKTVPAQTSPPQPPPSPIPALHEDHDDHHVLADAFGGNTSLSRAPSIRNSGQGHSRPQSLFGDTNVSPQSKLSNQARTPSRGSLRRDSRDVSEIRKMDQNRVSSIYDSADAKRLSTISYDSVDHKDLSGVIRNVGTADYTGLTFQDHNS